MRGPEIQKELRRLAALIISLADEMDRRKPVTRAKPTSTPMTQQKADKARKLHAQGFPQHVIAHRLNVNPGRVSEAIHGKRT